MGIAARFLDAFEATVRELAPRPWIGSPRENLHFPFYGVRSWPVRGFRKRLIFYRPIRGGIEVLHMLHAARDHDAIVGDRPSSDDDS